MSDNVVPFGNNQTPPELGEVRHDLIKVLEDVLAMAKSGQLQSLYASGFTSEGNRLSLMGGYHVNIYEVVGSMEALKIEYMAGKSEILNGG